MLKHLVVRGRMERVDAGEHILCYIDYAHNAMSLAKVLKMLRIYEPERILLVFGCGGNRAGRRRGGMGRVAGELANLTIITSDNPRWEEPAKIMADVEEGIKETSGAYRMIQDREEAVLFAVEMARQGDILLIAGKGHENYQEIQGVRYPMDDRELVRKAVRLAAQKRQKKEQHKNRFQYGELYQRNFYREVMEKNRVHYEYYHLGMTENVPEDYTEIFFVCLREDGCLELPATIETACRTAGRKVPELEGFHFHTLRHTYTTNLLSNGAQPKDVQELLGHSDVSTTMNVYAHATREAKRTSARILDKVAGND